MANGLPDLVARLRLDTSDLDRGLNDTKRKVSGAGLAVGAAFGGLAGAGLAAAGAAVTGFASGSVDAFAAVEDATGAAGVQFGESLPKVLAFADQASASLGLSKGAALDAANTFGTLGKAAGLSGGDLAGFATDFTALAGDMASFKGTSPEQAIEAIGAALRGESEPIRAYGVLLDDASLRQEALAQGLISTTKEALTPQQKVLAAQALIYKQTSDAQGDFARTSDSTANTQKRLAAETANARAELGEKFAPAVTFLRERFLDVIEGVSSLIDWVGPKFSAAIAAFKSGLILGDGEYGDTGVLAFIYKIGDAFGGLVEGFHGGGLKGGLAYFFSTIRDAITDALPEVQRRLESIARSFVDWVGPKIPPLLEAVGNLWIKVQTYMIGTVLPKVIETLAKWGAAFIEWVAPKIPPLLEQMGKLAERLLTYLATDALPKIVTKLAEWGAALIAWVAPKIPGLLLEMARMVGELTLYLGGKALTLIKDKVGDWADAAVNWVGDAVRKLPGKLAELGLTVTRAFTGKGGIIDDMQDMGKRMVEAIIDGIKSLPGKIGRALSDAVGKVNLPSLDVSFVGDGPGRGAVKGGSTLRRVQGIVESMGGRINGTYRTPEHNRRVGGSPSSYHLDRANPAVDIGGTTAQLDAIYARLRAMGGWRELLWRVPNHAPGDNPHIHVAHSGSAVHSGIARQPGDGPDERTIRTQLGELILSRSQVASLPRLVDLQRVVAQSALAALPAGGGVTDDLLRDLIDAVQENTLTVERVGYGAVDRAVTANRKGGDR